MDAGHINTLVNQIYLHVNDNTHTHKRTHANSANGIAHSSGEFKLYHIYFVMFTPVNLFTHTNNLISIVAPSPISLCVPLCLPVMWVTSAASSSGDTRVKGESCTAVSFLCERVSLCVRAKSEEERARGSLCQTLGEIKCYVCVSGDGGGEDWR